MPSDISVGEHPVNHIVICDKDFGVLFSRIYYDVDVGQSVTITVELSRVPGSEVEIPISASSRGPTDDSDWSGVPGTLTFGVSETRKRFAFSAAQDNDNDDETVKIGFGDLPSEVKSASPASTIVRIDDDEDPDVTVSFEKSS